jgi:hypothetical protein
MRVAVAVICLASCAGITLAQSQTADKSSADSPQSTGRTVSPETKGKMQPQGPTGPINTKSGGAPAASPQGETPPGMQSAPEGSSKTIVGPKYDVMSQTLEEQLNAEMKRVRVDDERLWAGEQQQAFSWSFGLRDVGSTEAAVMTKAACNPLHLQPRCRCRRPFCTLALAI